jgi:hypothetical protein
VTVVPSGYDLPKNELFQTPAWVTRALLRVVALRGLRIWEPFAGCHQMADVLRDAGNVVITSDIATYEREHDHLIDFFGPHVCTSPFDALVSNPPYGHTNRKAEAAARLALERCSGVVALLCTAKFDFGKQRRDLFADNPRFACKIALTDRVNWFEGGEYDNTESHAWYVWAHACGPLPAAPRLTYAGRDQ